MNYHDITIMGVVALLILAFGYFLGRRHRRTPASQVYDRPGTYTFRPNRATFLRRI